MVAERGGKRNRDNDRVERDRKKGARFPVVGIDKARAKSSLGSSISPVGGDVRGLNKIMCQPLS